MAIVDSAQKSKDFAAEWLKRKDFAPFQNAVPIRAKNYDSFSPIVYYDDSRNVGASSFSCSAERFGRNQDSFASHTASPNLEQQLQRVDRSKVKIVIADDEKSIQFTFKMALTKAGYNVVNTFSDGQYLMDYASHVARDEQLPDIVLLDYRMAVMDGLDTAKALRKLCPKTKILIISAVQLPEEIKDHCDGILRKPVSIDALKQSVEDVMQDGQTFP